MIISYTEEGPNDKILNGDELYEGVSGFIIHHPPLVPIRKVACQLATFARPNMVHKNGKIRFAIGKKIKLFNATPTTNGKNQTSL